MRYGRQAAMGLLGLAFGVVGTIAFANPFLIHHQHSLQPQDVQAATNDRFGDYVMCTGAVGINPKSPTDGVWMLDYKSGKLLGTVIDRTIGKIVGWAEVDLVAEYNIPPRTDVHFMMTTGSITQGQSALYVAEVTTGKFGVYTMAPGENGGGIIIRRHDLTTFRANKPVPVPAPVPAPMPPQIKPAPAAPPLPGQPMAPLPPVIVPDPAP